MDGWTDSRKTPINNVRKTMGATRGIGYKGKRSLVKTLVIIMKFLIQYPLDVRNGIWYTYCRCEEQGNLPMVEEPKCPLANRRTRNGHYQHDQGKQEPLREAL